MAEQFSNIFQLTGCFFTFLKLQTICIKQKIHEELLTLEQLTASAPGASVQISLTDASLLEETYQTKENEQYDQHLFMLFQPEPFSDCF